MKDISELLAPYWPILGLIALCFLIAILAAYLLGEWVGSRRLYEPLPAEHIPPLTEYPNDEAFILAEDIVTTASIAIVTTDVEEVAVQAGLARRYRRDALRETKRAQALADLMRLPRRPTQEALEQATIEVKGREVPLLPKGH